MVLANNYEQQLVVRLVQRSGSATDFAVPAKESRDLIPPDLEVTELAVFTARCEELMILVFGDGDVPFRRGGFITMDPVGLGDFAAGSHPSSGASAQPTDSCRGIPTPQPAPD
jgi:hypothetical protein